MMPHICGSKFTFPFFTLYLSQKRKKKSSYHQSFQPKKKKKVFTSLPLSPFNTFVISQLYHTTSTSVKNFVYINLLNIQITIRNCSQTSLGYNNRTNKQTILLCSNQDGQKNLYGLANQYNSIMFQSLIYIYINRVEFKLHLM